MDLGLTGKCAVAVVDGAAVRAHLERMVVGVIDLTHALLPGMRGQRAGELRHRLGGAGRRRADPVDLTGR